MKSFFSIISATPNIHSNESIAVGLIMVSNKIYFKYSKNKLNWIKKLEFGEGMFHLLEDALKKIELFSKKENSKKNYELFSNLLTSEYFSYLNQYSGGVLAFSEPVNFSLSIDNQRFKSYYERIVGEPFSQEEAKKSSFQKDIKTIYKKTNAKDFSDIDFVMKTQTFKGILKNTKLSLITVNGSVNAIQTIDFKQSEATVINNLYELGFIDYGLKKYCDQHNLPKEELKVAVEIPEEDSEKKGIFEKAYKENKDHYKFCSLSEIEDFLLQARASGEYSPFSQLL